MVQFELWEGNVNCLAAGTQETKKTPLSEGHNLETQSIAESNIQTHPHQVFQARDKYGISLSQ